MASSYPSRLWAQLAKCVYIITCGFCGTPSSALEDAALAEPLLRNAQQHPAASSEAPSSSVLPASQQQPALPAVSKASPKSATAAVRGPESKFSNNDVSGAHADPTTAKRAQSPGYASDDPSNMPVPDQQKSRNSPRSSVAGTPDSALTSKQALPFPKLKSPQPAQAHGPKDQAPSGPIPREPANSEFSHGEHAPLAAADKLPAPQPSKGSAAKPPVIEQNSKASTDRAEAAADKTSSAASSGTAAAAAAASSDSESCSQSEATPVSQTETASQELHGNSGAAALKTPLSDSAAKGVQSEAQVKPSGKDVAVSGDAAAKQSPIRPSAEKASTADKSSAAKGDSAKKSEVNSAATGEGSASTDTAAQQSPVKPTAEGASVAGKQSAAKGTVAKQNPDGPAAKEYLAAKERPAATGAAAKQSKGETSSAAESGQAAVSSSSQPVLQSTSKVKHSQQSIADHAAALAANESQSATAAPTGTASKPQRRVQGSTGNIESAGGKLEEEEIHRKTQPNKADEDRVDAEKPQSKNSTQGDAVHSAMDLLASASSKEAEHDDGPLGAGKLDSSSAQPQVPESPGVPKEPPRSVVANTASSNSQQDMTDADTLSEPQEKLAHAEDVQRPLSAQHNPGDSNGNAANSDSMDVDNSPSVSGQSGTANTAVKQASMRSNGTSQGGRHDVSPDQDGGRSDMGKHALNMHEGPDGTGLDVAAIGKPESDTAKTAGSDLPSGDAENGNHTAQTAETGSGQTGAAADARAGKKKHNKGKKKKKGK